MYEHNRLQEFDNYERKRIRPTTTGMPRDSGRTEALHKKEERRRGTARRERRESPSLSSYVENDDDGGDGDEATFPGGAKFFVKMQSARQRERHESRQKTRQRSRAVHPGRTGQDYLVFGALPSQIQLVSNEIRFFLQNIRGTMLRCITTPLPLRRTRRRRRMKKTRRGDAIFSRGRLLSLVIRRGVRVACRERDWARGTMRFPIRRTNLVGCCHFVS